MPSPCIPPGYHYDTQHDGFEHLAINNTFIRRLLIRLALRTTAKLYARDGACMPISKRIIVKRGFRVHLTEAATMKYLAERTSIPVPKVYASYVHKNIGYIVMERIQGKDLPKAWKELSEDSRENIFAQLKSILQELHALTPPPDAGIQSCIGGSLFDSRIPRGNPRFGPFKTIQEFHFWLRHDFQLEDLKRRPEDQDSHDLRDMINKQDGPWPPPRFAHGDLNPFNVIVRDGNVVGLIDWEFAGWYPHYWEYTSAWFGNLIRTEWQGFLDKMLDRPPPDVFKMEETRHKWWGEF